MKRTMCLGMMGCIFVVLAFGCVEQSAQGESAAVVEDADALVQYCSVDEQCRPGQVCEPMGPTCDKPLICMDGCHDDDDCGPGGTCEQPNCFTCPCPGFCSYDNDKGGCRDDGDCGDGEVCEPVGPNCDTKACVPGCHEDMDCDINQFCEERMCFTCPCPGECEDIPCESDEQCPEGTVCEPSGPLCGDPICVPGCRVDADCDSGERCTPRYCVTCPCPSVCE